MEQKRSFFRRPSDAEQEDSNNNQEHVVNEPRKGEEREHRPRRENHDNREYRSREDREDRVNRYDNEPRARRSVATRAPRGERIDYRKPENRQPKPAEEREAPENVIYGIHPVKEAIETAKAIEKIYFKRNSSDNESIAEIRDMVRGTNIVCQDVPQEKLDRLSRRGNHQGVVAVIPQIEYVEFSDLLERLSVTEVAPLVVVMDSVTDVRNFGAIARSAECAGADAIIMSAKNSAPVNAEAIRSSAGALNVIPVCRTGSLRNALKSLQMAGMQLVAATEKSNEILFEADLTKPTVIVMGSEDKGISSEILKMCDITIAIPLLGKIESLNVSAAASVMLFEAVRQRFLAIE